LVDQLLGIGGVTLLVFLSVRLAGAFREYARMARSGRLEEIEHGILGPGGLLRDPEDRSSPSA
jgi:hypothetical protein